MFNVTDQNSSNPIYNAYSIEMIYPYRLSVNYFNLYPIYIFYYFYKRGKNSTFISIFEQSLVSNLLMPSNIPINDLNLLEISSSNYPQTLISPIEKLSQSDMTNFVTYWTFADDPNTLYLPWVPFFSNCQGYGRKILWFDLLEYNKDCSFKSVEDTVIVESIPTKGLDPTADHCHINLQCAFSEEVNILTNLIKWWQINDKQTLYYIPSYGVTPDDYFTNRDHASTYFSSLIDGNTDEMVPVEFSSENFKANSYPSKVKLKMEYYQISNTVKKLVKATVVLSDFLIVDLNNLHPYYSLIVDFKAMDFLDLINAFQFGIPIYLLAFIMVSVFTLVGIVVFWGFNKTISKRENPPILKFGQTVKIVIIPPIFVMILFIY